MTHTLKRLGVKAVVALGLGLGAWTSVEAQRLTWLGTLPGGGASLASGVSADGSVVVGEAQNASGQLRAFRWTAQGGMEDLGTLGGDRSSAYGVSADGSVVVGGAENASRQKRAFRWTAQRGMQELDIPDQVWSVAYGVSADGTVVVGSARGTSWWGALRWTTQGGVQVNRLVWVAYGVSANGWVVVGSGYRQAFRWTIWGGVQNLGTLGGDESVAYDVSADGLVVVGAAEMRFYEGGTIDDHMHAFRWTPSRGMQYIGTHEDIRGYSRAYGVSADGSVVVGELFRFVDTIAFRWTAERGMEDLNATYGCLLTDGSWLAAATDISPDGRYIVGWGYNANAGGMRQAFLLDTLRTRYPDVDCSGCVDDADLLMVLLNFGLSSNYAGRTDVNEDGIVDDADLLEVLFNFGSGC